MLSFLKYFLIVLNIFYAILLFNNEEYGLIIFPLFFIFLIFLTENILIFLLKKDTLITSITEVRKHKFEFGLAFKSNFLNVLVVVMILICLSLIFSNHDLLMETRGHQIEISKKAKELEVYTIAIRQHRNEINELEQNQKDITKELERIKKEIEELKKQQKTNEIIKQKAIRLNF